MRLFAAAGLCGATLLLAGGVCAAAPWYIHTVDSRHVRAEYSSIALDAAGRPHISYDSCANEPPRHLAYAAWNGTSWDIQTVDSSQTVGQYSSLQLDSNGRPHISYHERFPTTTHLKYAAWNGVSWDIQTVDSDGFTGYHTSLALDASDRPHISYLRGASPNLRYATWNGTTWEIQTVDIAGDAASSTSLALDASGRPHISYCDVTNYDLKYASWNGTRWDIQTVDGGDRVGFGSSLALDASGYAHISYRDDNNGNVKYAAWNGSSWLIQTVDSCGTVWGKSTSLALDARGYPRITYVETVSQRPVKHELKYASWNGSTWEIETVDPAGWLWTEQMSLALDADGYAHISYAVNVGDGVHRVLRYATTRTTITLSHDLPTGGYYMVSLPLVLPGGTTLHDLLCDDLGHAPGDWYVWPWDAHTQAYEPGITPPACLTAAPDANSGYWLLTPAGRLDISGCVPADDQIIPLRPGWNAIGSLYAADMDSLWLYIEGGLRTLADAQAREWVLGTFYYFDHDANRYGSVTVGQSPPNRLSVWDGYWVLAGVDCSLIVPGPYSPLVPPRAVPSGLAAPTWALDIEAASATSTDTISIAASDSASDGFDDFNWDKPKPPRAPGRGTLRMVLIPGSASQPAPWASDLAMETRSAAQGKAEWQFTVSGGPEVEPVTLSWPQLSRLPKDHTAILTDEDTGQRTSMRTRAHYEFLAPGNATSRNFTVSVKPADQGALLITGLTAAPARGSTWDLGFNLSADAAVDARIHNIAGRLVADIAHDQQLSRGRASLAWNARSLTNTRVPSGAYVLRVTARTEDGQQASAMTMLQMPR